jgi:ferredoxin/coenzyme F420-reducing hydrogenase delta subunit
VALPWVARAPRPAPAVVQLDHCNGCGRCFEDCPFSALVLAPRSDGARHAVQAQVDPDLCAGCGICVGACPTATPFRSMDRLATGIELPDRPLAQARERLRAGLAADPGALVLFGCEEGADVGRCAGRGVVALALPCSAMLPPSFVEFALRCGAADVIVGSCGASGCAYRLGGRWTDERLTGRREPSLRAHARGPHVQVVDALSGEEARLQRAIRRTSAARLAATNPEPDRHA